MTSNNCSLLHGTVGIRNLKLCPEKRKLEERLTEGTGNKKDCSLMKNRIKNFHFGGQNVMIGSIPEAARLALKRDYSKIANFNGTQDIGPIFVPQGYIPKKSKVLNVVRYDVLQDLFPEEKEIVGYVVGDMTEKDVYFSLREYFIKKNEVAIIINNLHMIWLNSKSGHKNKEIDFLIINYTHHYVMVIEVKYALNKIKRKGLNSIETVKKQIDECKLYIEDWFGADISKNWKFIGCVYCEKLQTELQFCVKCYDFVFVGKNDLLKKLDRIID